MSNAQTQTWEQECLSHLIIRNSTGDIAILVLWNLMEKTVIPEIPPEMDRVSVIGNLRTPLGISWFLRGLGKLSRITTVVIWGSDLTNTGEALLSLWGTGMGKGNTIPGFGWPVDSHIPEAFIDTLKGGAVNLVDARKIKLRNILGLLEELEVNKVGRSQTKFPPVELPERTTLPHQGVIHLTARDPLEGWVKILQTICLAGDERETRKKETLLHTFGISISFPVPLRETVEPPFPFSQRDMDTYYKDMILVEPPPKGIDYRYGWRMQGWRKHNQLEEVTERLRRSPNTKRATIILLDPTDLAELKDAPCIAMITFCVQGKVLSSSVVIRSNDMFGGWPFNVLALLRVHRSVAEKLGIGLGTMHVLSQNAQIYQGSLPLANEIIEAWAPGPSAFPAGYLFEPDPAGNFVFTIKDEGVELKLIAPAGDRILLSAWNQDPSQLVGWLVATLPWLDQQHIRYLGREEEKLRRSLETGEPYIQG